MSKPTNTTFEENLHDIAFEGINKSYTKSIQIDKVRVAAGFTILVCFFISLSIDSFVDPLIKWIYLFAFLYILVGELLLLWRITRLPIRLDLLRKRSHETANEVTKIINTIIRAYVTPLVRYEEREHILKQISESKSGNEATEVLEARIKQLESGDTSGLSTKNEKLRKKADDYLSSLATLVLLAGRKLDIEKSFGEPLDERNAKFKHALDKFSEGFRIPIFYLGIMMIVGAIILDLLMK